MTFNAYKPMIKVGEKVLVLVKVTQIVEDEKGVRYVVEPNEKQGFCNTMWIEKEDIKEVYSA